MGWLRIVCACGDGVLSCRGKDGWHRGWLLDVGLVYVVS